MKAPSGDINSREEINRVFRLFDDDHTGTITFSNLQRITSELGQSSHLPIDPDTINLICRTHPTCFAPSINYVIHRTDITHLIHFKRGIHLRPHTRNSTWTDPFISHRLFTSRTPSTSFV
eukprot:GHVN01084672.1.p1 GENE.GHVN01084672.1~~GHVN01084672.1.p1  ORF type:complete len:120 (+),score=17.44 GHVN01084672.1:203-562(+)